MSVVSDSSSLIAFEKIGRLSLLPGLYHTIIIPGAVEEEVYSHSSRPRPSWIIVHPLSGPMPVTITSQSLGSGESEAIALSLEIGAALILLDDLDARELADSLGLTVVGAGGVLLAAKLNGLIPAVKPALEDLVRTGFWLTPTLRRKILRRAGEPD